MTTLAEIQAAVETLSLAEKQELFVFLATKLRTGIGQIPAPREFSQEQIESWIADDEAEMHRFRERQ